MQYSLKPLVGLGQTQVPLFSCLFALGFYRLSATLTLISVLSFCTTMGLESCPLLCTQPGLSIWRAKDSCNMPVPSSGEEFTTRRNLKSCCRNNTGSQKMKLCVVFPALKCNICSGDNVIVISFSLLWKMWLIEWKGKKLPRNNTSNTFSSASVCVLCFCILTVNCTVCQVVYIELYTAVKK